DGAADLPCEASVEETGQRSSGRREGRAGRERGAGFGAVIVFSQTLFRLAGRPERFARIFSTTAFTSQFIFSASNTSHGNLPSKLPVCCGERGRRGFLRGAVIAVQSGGEAVRIASRRKTIAFFLSLGICL